MPKNRPNPGSPQDWLERARSDLAIANAPLPDGAYYEDLCFHAQQAAEKALKAVYQHYGYTFRYTHDLDELVTGLKLKGVQIPANIEEATSLSNFAWEARYPSLYEPVSEEEFREALKMARNVVAWAEKELNH